MKASALKSPGGESVLAFEPYQRPDEASVLRGRRRCKVSFYQRQQLVNVFDLSLPIAVDHYLECIRSRWTVSTNAK